MPDTRRLDRMVRMPIYAQYEVPYLRLIDPMDKTLEVYRLKEGEWWWLRRPMRYELRL
ncbi:MAG: Uma2 family endonuclease [Syntrophobacteraceae bacterium]